MSITPPFKAKMDTEQYMLMAQSLRERGKTLVQCYEDAEAIHEAFFNQDKYKNFESFKKEYYKYHPTRR